MWQHEARLHGTTFGVTAVAGTDMSLASLVALTAVGGGDGAEGGRDSGRLWTELQVLVQGTRSLGHGSEEGS